MEKEELKFWEVMFHPSKHTTFNHETTFILFWMFILVWLGIAILTIYMLITNPEHMVKVAEMWFGI